MSEPAPAPAPQAAASAPMDAKTRTARAAGEAEGSPRRGGGSASSSAAKFVMVLVLFAVIAFAVAETVPWYRPVGGGEDPDSIAEALFDRYVVAFEVLGLLLTAALLGAMYLAFREATP